MHLKSIRMRGFKSFPDQVEVRLEQGVAVVVGPNGSGKSNIADALVWAAGSLAPSELRAEKPDDVLFAGAAGRKPVDACEVELLFDNADGGVPGVEFSEVSIVRRLHRGGEGQYLVNGAPVRRLDIVELLADVGLGSGSGSIVSQGKVEAILSSRPEERRALVEEAAGLGRYKRRRHRAELKLARVGQQVERARDVEAEVVKRLRPLALQATAAERAEKLGDEIARLRAGVAARDLDDARARREDAHARRAKAMTVRREIESRLAALLSDRQAAEEELADVAGSREASTAALYRLRSAAERLGLRREAAEALVESLAAELDAARAASPTLLLEREAVAVETESAAAAARARRDEASAAAAGTYAALLLRQRDAVDATQVRLDALAGERVGIEAALGEATARRRAAADTLLRLRTLRERLVLRQESGRQLGERVAADLAEARAVAAAGGPSPDELEAAATAADERAREAVKERDDLDQRLRLAREGLAAVERALARREGVEAAARRLADAGADLALSLIHVEPGYERAVSAALAWRASALVAEDPRAALDLLDRAHADGLGGVSVLTGARGAGAVPAAATALGDHVRGRADLLAGIWVVDRELLLDVRSGVAVTREGYGYDPERGELWLVGETPESVLLELDARRGGLEAEAAELEPQAAAAAKAAEAAAGRAREADEAFRAVAHLRRAHRLDGALLDRAAAAHARLDGVLLAAARHAAGLEEPLTAEADSGSDADGLAERLRALSTAEAELRRALADAAARAAASERAALALGWEEGAPVADDPAVSEEGLIVTARELTEQVAAAEAALTRAGAAAQEAALELAEARRASDSRSSPARLERLGSAARRLDAALAAALVGVERFEAPLRARVAAGAARVTGLGSELQRLAGEEVEAHRELNAAAEALSALDVELARVDSDIHDARRRLEDAGSEPVEGERGELAGKLERLERRREQLGNVNPFAKEEYAEEKERLAALQEQRDDLERSLAELEKLRDDLTATVERRFAETFGAVERNFAEVAATLFPGGEGRLRLTEPEDEEGDHGIEVELRPAGKRITRLSLLSGGEKALGALSFLFSLFLARPCAFYLLDEVEAALDDTNIGRFVELLRRFSDRAQFIVITHQKRTMEAADILYGVTMGGDGVSQVLSRKLPREDAAALSVA